MKVKILPFYLGLAIAFGILLIRLFQVSIIEGQRNRELADNQRIRLRKISAPRGIIFDRNNKPLVRNIPIFRYCPHDRKECQIITREEAIMLEVENKETNLLIDIGRSYPYGESLAHLLGYLGQSTKDEVKTGKWKIGSMVGRDGIEGRNDAYLKGVDGGELVEVDTNGKTLRKIGKKEPIAGGDIHLTIDAELQKTAYEALGGKKGAVVATKTGTGEVLILTSSPSFNPEMLTRAQEFSSEQIERIFNNPDHPLFNRAISGLYPPGSTFKIVTSVAALEEKEIDARTQIDDPGVITVGKYSYSNWYFTQYGRTEGSVDIVKALKRSTDTFFYKVGEMVGPQKIISWSKTFGLGQTLGIDIPGEVSGLLPDPSRNWYLGNTYHLAIGQGALQLTPLQVNVMSSVIANKGKFCPPRVIKNNKPAECRDLKLKPETIRLITEGMKEACAPGGTAYPLFNFQVPATHPSTSLRASNLQLTTIPIACKTGTAEFDDPQGRTHAWLTAFVLPDEALAKSGRDQIVITVLVEAGGEGSRVAAPIVKKVLEEYFRK